MGKKKVESEYIGKSKYMRCTRYGNWGGMHVIINGEPLGEVDCVKYLGPKEAADGGCERDVVHRMNFVCSLVFDIRHVTTKEHWCPKRASSIQYGYRKWGTHARVFSQSPAHGNSKIEIRQ